MKFSKTSIVQQNFLIMEASTATNVCLSRCFKHSEVKFEVSRLKSYSNILSIIIVIHIIIQTLLYSRLDTLHLFSPAKKNGRILIDSDN